MSKKIKIILLIVIICILAIGITSYFVSKSMREYEIEEITQRNYYLLYDNGKIGVISNNGTVLIEAKYDSIQIPNPLKPVFICMGSYNKQSGKYDEIIIKNEKNEQIFTQYDEVYSLELNGITSEIPYEKSALMYRKGNKYGLINFEGKEVTKAVYDEIKSLPYKEGEYIVKKDGKYGVINSKGTQMIKIEYDQIYGDGYYDKNYKNAGYIVGIKEDNGYVYGYINSEGKELLKKEFNEITRINEITEDNQIVLIVSQNGKEGLYINNKQVINCEYQELEYDGQTELLIAKKSDRYGVMSLDGQVIIPIENKSINFKGIRIVAVNDIGTSEYDLKGNAIQDTKYKTVLPTENSEFFITVNQSNQYGLINQKNVEVVENKYAYLEYLTDKYFVVYSDENKMGVIDSNGRKILDTKYDVIQKIKGSNVIQVIQLDKKIIELYSNDIKQIACKDSARIYVYDNYIKLWNQNSVDYFTVDGTKITSKELFSNNTLFATVKNGLWGFCDKEGKVIVDTQYENVTEFNEYGYAGIKKAGKWGIIDQNGNIIVQPIYSIEQNNSEPSFLNEFYKVNYHGETYYSNEVK